jgi:hypothetical protein
MSLSWQTFPFLVLSGYALTRLITGEYAGPYGLLKALRVVLEFVLRGLTQCPTCTAVFSSLTLTLLVSQSQALTLLDWFIFPLSIAGGVIVLDELIVILQATASLLGAMLELFNGGNEDDTLFD